MTSQASTTSRSSPPSCDHCGKQAETDRPVLVAMVPGRDGKAWFLCVRCWSDGLKSMHGAGGAPKPVNDDAPPSAKDEVADFSRPKRKARSR